MLTKWEVKSFDSSSSTVKEYLEAGWEPFAVTSRNSSYEYNNGKDTHHKSTDYIYLRRLVPRGE